MMYSQLHQRSILITLRFKAEISNCDSSNLHMFKVLVIRFSSIGDIVLTSPVVRALKQQKAAKVHFVCKAGFSKLMSSNPNVDKVWPWQDGNKKTLLDELKAEKFDLIVDLHKNIRSLIIRNRLRVKAITFNKLNLEKWLIVNLKWDKLPQIHLVDRYFNALSEIGIENDDQGLDYFIPGETSSIDQLLPETIQTQQYICLAIGAAHRTKQIPIEKLSEILEQFQTSILLLGGKSELELAQNIENLKFKHVHNLVGKTSLHESARLIQFSKLLITPDTGMMHIGAALKIPIVSIWGNTIPSFGMYPYYPIGATKFKNIEVNNLNCRPCSKIGKNQCPKGHFDCMKKISSLAIKSAADQLNKN